MRIEEFTQRGAAHWIWIVVHAVVASVEAGDPCAQLLGIEIADPLGIGTAQALEPGAQVPEQLMPGLPAPLAALHRLAVAGEVFGRHAAQEEHVVIEIDEVFGQTRDAMQ